MVESLQERSLEVAIVVTSRRYFTIDNIILEDAESALLVRMLSEHHAHYRMWVWLKEQKPVTCSNDEYNDTVNCTLATPTALLLENPLSDID